MKHILLITFLSLVGCVTSAPLTYQEHCALQGMSLHGVTDTDVSGVAIGSHGSSTSAFSSARSVSCEVPKTEAQSCEVKRLTTVAAPKIEYNSHLPGRKWITGVGYVAFILPGAGAKLYYDTKYDAAIEESSKLNEQTKNSCMPAKDAPEVRLPSSK